MSLHYISMEANSLSWGNFTL